LLFLFGGIWQGSSRAPSFGIPSSAPNTAPRYPPRSMLTIPLIFLCLGLGGLSPALVRVGVGLDRGLGRPGRRRTTPSPADPRLGPSRPGPASAQDGKPPGGAHEDRGSRPIYFGPFRQTRALAAQIGSLHRFGRKRPVVGRQIRGRTCGFVAPPLIFVL
jgi:hypothetical protein